jgi:hypothetical protein
LKALEAQLQSAQEATTDVLGLDVEYHRGQGVMRLRAQTKITAFRKREHLTAYFATRVTPHDKPMTPAIAKAMTKNNCPVTSLEKEKMHDKAKQYRTYGWIGQQSGSGFINRPREPLGAFASLDRF